MYSYIGKPCSAYCTAGASTSLTVFVPYVSSTVRYASTAPGTVNDRCASGPGPVGIRSSLRPRKNAIVASAGATPWPLTAWISRVRAS
jgi:hypothetical protein